MKRRISYFFFMTMMTITTTAKGAEAIDPKTAIDIALACQADSRKLCNGIIPGGGRILACLNQHRNELNQICAKAVAVFSLCLADWQKFCPDAGAKELGSCLGKFDTQLKPECRDLLAKIGAR